MTTHHEPMVSERDVPAAEAVRSSMRRAITAGRLRPGSRLVDQVLATEYAVSRNTVRDALKQLTMDGLVVSVRNAGSSVRALSAGDIHDIYTARRLLETGAIAQSSNAPDLLLQQVELAAASSEKHMQSGDWNNVGTSSLAFHQSVVRLAGSERLDAFFENLAAQLRLAFAVMPDESAFQVSWVGRDRDIADLILSGRRDEATAQLKDYLNESEAQLTDGVRAAARTHAKLTNIERTS